MILGFAVIITVWFMVGLVEQWVKPKPIRPKMDRVAEPGQVLMEDENLGQGVYLGEGKGGKPYFLSVSELNKHTALVGTTGSGKTTTIFNFVYYALAVGQACVIIDGKGDAVFRTVIESMAQAANREYRTFSMSDEAQKYNPFALGTPSEMTDKIMAMTEWSEEHYKLSAQRYLQLLFRILQLRQVKPDLPTISRFCNRSELLELLQRKAPNSQQTVDLAEQIDFDAFDNIAASEELVVASEIKELADCLEAIDRKAIDGLASRIGVLSEGDLRDSLQGDHSAFTLEEILSERLLGLFSLDSLRYPEQARLIGKLVISDLKTSMSCHSRNRHGQRVSLIFDEFNVFASASVVDLVNKARSAGFEALLAFQSLADIDVLPHGEAIRRQIIQNCNTLIVQRQNDPKDANELAAAIGSHNTYQLTIQAGIESGPTGMGSVRKVEEYLFHPNQIKGLRTGEALIKRNTARGMETEQVRIRELQLQPTVGTALS